MSVPATSQLSHQDGAYALDLSQDQHAHMQHLEAAPSGDSIIANVAPIDVELSTALREKMEVFNAQEAARIQAQMSAPAPRDQGASPSSSTTEEDAMEDSMRALILDRVLATFLDDSPECLEDAQIKKFEPQGMVMVESFSPIGIMQVPLSTSRDQGVFASSSTTEADAMEDSMHASILDRVLASFSTDFPIEFLGDAQVKNQSLEVLTQKNVNNV
ncbi:MAG: hypothetical protein JSS62_06430 [Verrucomicrobia bacterium]|nr:hypothetical protein [Verrucomicrobiota bacterium]MBS0646324.1 hypothetical protein [Verrucomicrobiota bacterium]